MKIDLEKIKSELKDYDKLKVDIFIEYLRLLQTDKHTKPPSSGFAKIGDIKAWWIISVENKQLIHFFKIVDSEGLVLDGDTVTLVYRKPKLMLDFSYQAYKNLVIRRYPESVFDTQLVIEGDEFSFKKENGKVIYKHNINNPFLRPSKDNVVGAYAIVKNRTGEFLETMGVEEIEECRKAANTDFTWQNWYGRMCLKTPTKRVCKVNFKDIVDNIDKLDNENYDLGKLEEKKGASISFFKALVNYRADSDKLIEEYGKMDYEEQKVYYRQIQDEQKKQKELQEEIKNEQSI